MTTYFEADLLIQWSDIEARAKGIIDDLDDMEQSEKDSVLQWVHDELFLEADKGVKVRFPDGSMKATPGSSQFKLSELRRLQVNLGAWAASFSVDNPAGTGSLSGVSIGSFSISNTMAKNNATADDLKNANQFGSVVTNILRQRPRVHMMI